jgi:hypothetical protein
VREKLKLRLGLDGPAGSGKSYTGLRFAMALAAAAGGRVAAIDTEFGSLSKYQGLAPDGVPFDFDVCELDRFSPDDYVGVIGEAAQMGAAVLVIDSLSHAWEGKGGALDQVDKAKGDNRFTAWKDITPKQRRMVDAILRFPGHVIATMRTKTEYVLEPNERGKMVPRKVGLKPVQREGLEYEFDIFGDMDADHTLTITKSRCPEVADAVVGKPGAAWLAPVMAWLDTGAAPAPQPPPAEFRRAEPAPGPSGEVAAVSRALYARRLTDSPDEAALRAPDVESIRRLKADLWKARSAAYQRAVTELFEADDPGEFEAAVDAVLSRGRDGYAGDEWGRLLEVVEDRKAELGPAPAGHGGE